MEPKINFDNTIDDEEIESRYIWCSWPYNLLKIDPIEMKSELINVESIHLSFCNIPYKKILLKNYWEEELFYSFSDSDFDGVMEKQKIILQKGVAYEQVSKFVSCYYKGNVYEFYQFYYPRDFKTTVRKLDLLKLQWRQLNSAGKDLGVSCCVGYKNKIILTGKLNKYIWIYDLTLESYSEIPIDFGTHSHKFLFRKSDEIFLFDFYIGMVYVNNGNLYDWSNFFSIELEGILVGPASRWFANYSYCEENLYFLLKNKIYCFDFKEENLYLKGEIFDEFIYDSLNIEYYN